MQAPFVRYRLAAATSPPPLLLRVSLHFGRPQQGQQHATISFLVQWATSPALTGHLRRLLLDLDVDAALGTPAKVRSLQGYTLMAASRLRTPQRACGEAFSVSIDGTTSGGF